VNIDSVCYDLNMEYAKELYSKIQSLSEIEGAMVVGLSGQLGAGKTALTKEIAKIMGIDREVTSPTYVIMKIYETKDERWSRLVHIDAYRLEDGQELQAIDFEKIVSDKKNLVIIEWPENVESILKGVENIRLHIEVQDDGRREYTVVVI
jgi:tRNA threonylcarbamoyladenosine biosynthesis protein TsaE